MVLCNAAHGNESCTIRNAWCLGVRCTMTRCGVVVLWRMRYAMVCDMLSNAML